MHGDHRLGVTLHNLLTQWNTGPFALLTLVTVLVAGVWYVQSAWALSAKGRTWSRWRTTSFLTGLVMIDLALQSPVSTFTMGYFEAHMVQHLLLMVTAPPLLALGAPMTLALQTSSRPVKVRLLRVLNSRPFRWWSHPVPSAAVYYVGMFVFFLTSALGLAMEHMWAMDLVNLAFLTASMHFWWPIVGVDYIPHWPMSHGTKMVALLIGVPLESFSAVPTPARPSSGSAPRPSPSSPSFRSSCSGCGSRDGGPPGSTPSSMPPTRRRARPSPQSTTEAPDAGHAAVKV
jgi:cytochrome c oxidase assembly factor CtaG